jgi:trimethylamine--corrinoid protein Co-methyltransferase
VERGKINAYTRANGIWKKMLTEYEQPALDPAIDDALKDYMNRRKLEISGGV